MSKLEKMGLIMQSENNAVVLLNTIINGYGVKDTLECIFYGLNVADQERFLDEVMGKLA